MNSTEAEAEATTEETNFSMKKSSSTEISKRVMCGNPNPIA